MPDGSKLAPKVAKPLGSPQLYNLGRQEELEAHIHRLSCVGMVLKILVRDFGLMPSARRYRRRLIGDTEFAT